MFRPFFIRSKGQTQLRFAGHNKWSKIRHAKGANDQQKGRETSRITRQIVSAIKAMSGETDPSHNHYLAAALHAAKMHQIPKTTVQEAIRRGEGDKSKASDLKLNRYEGIGPNGVAVIIEALVSNPAKTIADIKLIFKKAGGSMGSVEYLFDKRGRVVFKPGSTGHGLEQMQEAAIDLNAEHLGSEDPNDCSLEVLCKVEDIFKVQNELTNRGYEVIEWTNGFVPKDRIEVSMESEFNSFLDQLENQEEVTHVYHNAT